MPQSVRARKPRPKPKSKSPDATPDKSRPVPETGSPGREANGRFARGNPGGPGNPHARFSAHMLTIARQTMTPEKMAAVFEAVYIKALTGDMNAAKLLLHYTIGKPGDAPHPDHIERDEWDLHRKNGMTVDEMKQALGRMPCSLGNEIVSTALPAMTEARASELAAQLRGDEPNGNEDLETTVMNDGRVSKSSQDQSATQDNPCDRRVAPPLTNRNSEGKTKPGESRRRIAKMQSPATNHQPPATHSAPLTNRVSGGSVEGKMGRKLVAKQWLQPLARKVAGQKQEGKKHRAVRA